MLWICILIGIVPAVVVGIILGPLAAKFLSAERWGSAAEGQQDAITLVRSQLHMRKLKLSNAI
jgi:uncharacterized membrane-anchored protein YhcB (DUF1043 family)